MLNTTLTITVIVLEHLTLYYLSENSEGMNVTPHLNFCFSVTNIKTSCYHQVHSSSMESIDSSIARSSLTVFIILISILGIQEMADKLESMN